MGNLEKFNSFGNKKLLFVGVGNALKSDDAVGIFICERINSRDRIIKIVVESGIERFIGKINGFEPDILILVDCTDFGEAPGYYDLLPVDEVKDNTFNTHTVSLNRIGEFFPMKTWLLGIQPRFTGFGESMSSEVARTAEKIIYYINEKL